jgi:prevent-host-death family protein
VQASVTNAKGQLTELVRRAEAGDEIILTRHGHAAVRLVPVGTPSGQKREGLYLRRYVQTLPPKLRPDRAPREARIFFTPIMGCLIDRRGHLRFDGDCC